MLLPRRSGEEEPPPRLRRRDRWFRYTLPVPTRPSPACLSSTPSLLPRGPLVQGLSSASTTAFGYGVGVAALVWREFADRRARQPRRAPARSRHRGHPWRWWRPSSSGSGAVADPRAHDVDRRTLTLVLLPIVAVLIFVGLVALGRVIRKGIDACRSCSPDGWAREPLARSAGDWSLFSSCSPSTVC